VTEIYGNDNGGGGSGPNGHRVAVHYTIQGQNVVGNYTDVYWAYGVDYGNPNWWNNITNRSVTMSVAVGASISGISGYGTSFSSAPVINTSDPGYGGQLHWFVDGVFRIFHNSNGQGTFRINAAMSFNNNQYTSSIVNFDVALANIIRPPTAPSALTSSRISDSQINLAWTNNSGSFTAYENVKVFRSTDGGGFALIATLGVVTSYNDTGVSANHKYTYKVQASNAAGTADSSTTTALWNTPGTPTSLVATKLAGGNIRLNWTNNVNYSEYTVRIEESQNGGAYSELTSVATGTTQYDHVAPSTSVTHKYRIRARTSSGTTLNSAYSNETATIVLLSTANAPSGLSPSGPTFDATEAIVLTWTHNPTDATPQSSYRIQYEVNGGGTVTVGPTSSTVSSYTLPASTVANGATITWRVATAAQNATLSANSATATFFTQNRPTSTISVPGSSVNTSLLTAFWTYFQAQSSVQSSWHAYLWRKGALSDFSDATLLEEQVGSGTTAQITFTTPLLDAVTYGVRVFVTSAAGLASVAAGTELQEFLVTFLPPASATLTASYEADYGRMIVSVTGSAAVGGVTEAIVSVDLQRQINGGEWVTWATGIILSVGTLMAILVDTAPTVNGTNKYRAITYSALPSSVFSADITNVTAETRWGFLSAGGSFEELVRVRARLSTRSLVGRSRDRYHFAGREKPVELSGEETNLALSVAATLYPPSRGGQSSEPQELEALALTQGTVLWRDYTGRRIFASLSGVGVDYNNDSVLYPAAFNLTEVDYDENVG